MSTDYSDYSKQLSYEERFMMNDLHCQGFNHNELVDQHCHNLNAELVEWMEKAGKGILIELAAVQKHIIKIQNEAENVQGEKNPVLAQLAQTVTLLETSSVELEKQVVELKRAITTGQEEVAAGMERREKLMARLVELKQRLPTNENETRRYKNLNYGQTLLGVALSSSVVKNTKVTK